MRNLTEIYLLPEDYKDGNNIALGQPFVILLDGRPIYQNKNIYTEVKQISEAESNQLLSK